LKTVNRIHKSRKVGQIFKAHTKQKIGGIGEKMRLLFLNSWKGSFTSMNYGANKPKQFWKAYSILIIAVRTTTDSKFICFCEISFIFIHAFKFSMQAHILICFFFMRGINYFGWEETNFCSVFTLLRCIHINSAFKIFQSFFYQWRTVLLLILKIQILIKLDKSSVET
jgi:hypothetical protein